MEKASIVVKVMYDGAEEILAAGLSAAQAVRLRKPYERMELLAIRNGFIDEWQPRGGVEMRMVDMLTQYYMAWPFWLLRSFDAANNLDFAEEQMKWTKTPYDRGEWRPPRVTAVEYLERANQMANRYQRMFLRTLRQMRDLRRYSQPVIVNNARQVNVARNGGQQVNVQNKRKRSA